MRARRETAKYNKAALAMNIALGKAATVAP
jgi:hypothetical protein